MFQIVLPDCRSYKCFVWFVELISFLATTNHSLHKGSLIAFSFFFSSCLIDIQRKNSSISLGFLQTCHVTWVFELQAPSYSLYSYASWAVRQGLMWPHLSVEMRNMPSGKPLQLRGRASVCVCHTLVRNPEDKDGSHKFWCKEDLEKKYSLISYTEKCIWYFDNCSTDDSYFICDWYLILITSTAPIMYIYKWCAFLCKHMTLFFLYFSISSLNYFELVILIELCTGCISH